MSQCHLEPDGGDYMVIGWDPPLHTFFCVVEFEKHGDAGPVLWLGTSPNEFRYNPDPLIDAIAQYAPPFDRDKLRTELLRDRAADDAVRMYRVD